MDSFYITDSGFNYLINKDLNNSNKLYMIYLNLTVKMKSSMEGKKLGQFYVKT